MKGRKTTIAERPTDSPQLAFDLQIIKVEASLLKKHHQLGDEIRKHGLTTHPRNYTVRDGYCKFY